MDYDSEHNYSRWSYATSNARAEPIPAQRPHEPHSRIPCPPPSVPTPPKPTKISAGVYLEPDGFVYSQEYPPVLEYLDEVREAKTMLPPPSDLVLALAALSVLQHTDDVAHWIFWAKATYWTMGELVDSIALQKSRLIISPIPWNGHREYRSIVASRQEKFTCTVVQGKWYPTDCTGADAHKRTLRSTADQAEMTANEYFGIVENEGPSRRRNAKKRAVVPAATNKRTRRPAPVVSKARASASPDLAIPANDENGTAAIQPDSNIQATSAPRASTRVRRKVTPSARSPRIITAATATDSPEEALLPVPAVPVEPTTTSMLPPASAHARNRSSSAQSSVSTETIAVVERSPSVTSVETAVAPSSSKKRKVDEAGLEEELVKVVANVVDAAGGMVTRNRASRASSRMSTPVVAVEQSAKVTRPRNRAKRARV